MKRNMIKTISINLVIIMLFLMIPLNAYAEDTLIKIDAPIIEIKTEKSKYGLTDVADVTVTVYPSSEIPVEYVNIETSVNGQLVVLKDGVFSKETELLTKDGITYKFQVALSRKSTKLNIFQKIIMFFVNIFKKLKTVDVFKPNYNDGREKVSVNKEIYFSSIKGEITVDVWYVDNIKNVDTDGDNLIDYIEKIYGFNPSSIDTDNDKLDDYYEFVILGTDPLKFDTDGDEINDYEEDNDSDGLSNGFESEIGTSPNSVDTDRDNLSDKEEVELYYCNPADDDTDDDGASDGWEIENGYDANSYNKSFDVNVECNVENLVASVELSIPGENVETINISPVKNDTLINDSIPGYLGDAVDITAKGDIGIAKICFEFDENLLNDPNFIPTIYCLNEEKQSLYEYETKLYGNVAVAQSTHFSKYILLNKSVYEKHLKETYNIDYSQDSGVDSNADGISDYITKLMCEGVIRTGTGVKVFGDFTYDEVQSNNDIDADGIINGDEIIVDYSYIDIPDDAVEYNDHYYKIFDIGYIWDDAEAYCESIGGYLVTITSKEEQNVVEQILASGTKNSYWLGAQNRNLGWSWATGEKWSYTKWASGQPDNYCYNEETLMIYRNKNPLHYGTNSFGYWNDLLNDGTCNNEEFFGLENFGLICEWGTYQVNSHNYTFINSSPIHSDTDKDGFVDAIDPTPNEAEVFADMTSYKKYYFDDETIVTFFARQPVWNSRTCYKFSAPEYPSGYFASSGSGHSFIGIDYPNEEQDYFGFGANTSGESSGYPGIAVLRNWTTGEWYNELNGFCFSVGKTFKVKESDITSIDEYRKDHKYDKYHISKNNCTTIAVEILEKLNLDPKIKEHWWTSSGNIAAIAAWTYYGYSPADACQDIRANYDSYICYKIYTLKDGTKCWAIEVFGDPHSI